MDFTAAAWIWLYVGAFLMLAEIVSPGFVIFFFGLSACTVALLKGCVPALSLSWQLALFSVFSILYLVVLRRLVKGVFMGETGADNRLRSDYEGRVGKVVETIRPEVPGRILLGDAEWTAAAAERIEAGQEVRVVGQENLTLQVRRLEA